MYTLSYEEIKSVSGAGCPICLATAATAAFGASGVAIALTSNQLALLAAGGFILTSSLLYAMLHSKDDFITSSLI